MTGTHSNSPLHSCRWPCDLLVTPVVYDREIRDRNDVAGKICQQNNGECAMSLADLKAEHFVCILN